MSSKFDIERFDGKTSFALWQVCMAAILSTLGIKDIIYGREVDAKMTDKKWKEMDDKALFTIQLCLSDIILRRGSLRNDRYGFVEEVGGDVYEEVFNKLVAVEAMPLHSSYG